MKNIKTKITILVLSVFLLSASVTLAFTKDVFQEVYNDLFAKILTGSADIDIYKIVDPEKGVICYVSYIKVIGQEPDHKLSCVK